MEPPAASLFAYLPGTLGAIRIDGFAEVLVNGLVVRSAPDGDPAADVGGWSVDPRLNAGDRLFVVDGPVKRTGTDWYQVQSMNTAELFGWVAAASRDGVPWIQGVDVECPGGPVTIEVLGSLKPQEMLACFGGADLTFTAWARGVGFADGPVWGSPEWLAPLRDFWGVGTASGPVIDVVFAPDTVGPVSDLPPSDVEPWHGMEYRLTGHFDDPASSTCRAGVYDEQTGDSVEFPAAQSRLMCRVRFVITERALIAATPTSTPYEISLPPAATVPYTYLPAGPGPLRVDRFARVVVDDLVVRSQPFVGAGSQILESHLAAGQRLFVVAGPVAGSGYDWYRVRAMPTDDLSPRSVGWVAAASRGGAPWIEGLDVACPDGAPNVAVLVRLAPEERFACYGGTPLRFAAWARGIAVVDGPTRSSGFWLVGGRTGPTMAAVFAPDLRGREGPWESGSRYRLTGYFTPDLFVIASRELIGGS